MDDMNAQQIANIILWLVWLCLSGVVGGWLLLMLIWMVVK